MNYQLSDILGSANTAGDIRYCENQIFSANYNTIKSYDLKTLKSKVLPFEVIYNIKQFAISPKLIAVVDSRNYLRIYNRNYILLLTKKIYHCDSIEFSHDYTYLIYCTDKTVTLLEAETFKPLLVKDLLFSPKRVLISADNSCIIAYNIQNVVVVPIPFTLSTNISNFEEYQNVTKMFPFKQFSVDSNKPICSIETVLNSNPFNLLEYIDKLTSSTLSEQEYEVINKNFVDSTFARFDMIIVYQTNEVEEWVPGNSAENEAIEGFSFILRGTREIESDEIQVASSSNLQITASNVLEANAQCQVILGFSVGSFAILDSDLNLTSSASLTSYPITSIAFTGEYVAIASKFEKSLKIFNANSSVLKFDELTLVNLTASALSPDSRFLACGTLSGEIIVYDLIRATQYERYQAHNGSVNGICFMNKTKGLVSAGPDCVAAYDLKKALLFKTFTTEENGFELVSIDDSDEIIAAADSEFNVNLFDLRAGLLLEECKYHDGPITALKFNENGNGQLFSSSWDKTLKIMDCFTAGKPIQTLDESAEVAGFQILEGNNILICLSNACIEVFDIVTGQLKSQVDCKKLLSSGVIKKNYEAFELKAYNARNGLLAVGGDSKYCLLFRLVDNTRLEFLQRIQYSINLDFQNIDADDVLEQKREVKQPVSQSDKYLERLTEEIDLKTRKWVDPIAEIENRKLNARIVDICQLDNLEIVLITSFGVLIERNFGSPAEIRKNFTIGEYNESIARQNIPEALIISCCLTLQEQALSCFLRLQGSNWLLEINPSYYQYIVTMLADLLEQSNGLECIRLVSLSRDLLRHYNGEKSCEFAILRLNSVLQAKTELLLKIGVSSLQMISAAQRYTFCESEEESKNIEEQILQAKMERMRSYLKKQRAKEQGIIQ